MKNKANKILNIAVPLVTFFCIFALWAAAAAITDEEIILPRPSSALKEFFALFADKKFYRAYFTTLLRSLIAFVVSFTLAFAAAAGARKSRNAARVIGTLLPLVRALPTVAVVLLLVLWTSSRTAAVVVTMLVVLPTLYTNAESALSAADKETAEMCRVYHIPVKTRVFKIYLPQILPPAVVAAGAGFSLNLKLMVAAEVIAATAEGMGTLLNLDKIYFESAHMLALVLVIVLTGILVESAAKGIAKAMVKKYA